MNYAQTNYGNRIIGKLRASNSPTVALRIEELLEDAYLVGQLSRTDEVVTAIKSKTELVERMKVLLDLIIKAQKEESIKYNELLRKL